MRNNWAIDLVGISWVHAFEYQAKQFYVCLTGFFLPLDPALLKPSIKAWPSQEIAPGLNLTIECQGPKKDLNFSLYKSSTLIASQITEPGGNTTKFSFSMVSTNNTGNYSCQYHRTRSFIWSLPSNFMQIVMRDEDSGLAPFFQLPFKSCSWFISGCFEDCG